MATLLMHLAGNRSLNYTIFPPHLYIYDNQIHYKKRHLLSQEEATINYGHISEVFISKYLIPYAHLEIVSTGNVHIKVKWLPKNDAKKAKEIIDQKVIQIHRHKTHKAPEESEQGIDKFELSLKRLNELVSAGKITKAEYTSRRKQLLKKHY